MAEHAPGPGWLIPHNLPRPLDLAPAPIVEQFADVGGGRAPAARRRAGAREPTARTADELHDAATSARQAELAPHPTLLVHPDDAATHGITDGDDVEIESRHGTTHATAEVTETIRRGVVSVPHGWAGPNVNALTSDLEDCDPLTGMPRYSGFPVRVRVAQPVGS